MDDITFIRAALAKLPSQCRYHGTNTEPTGLIRGEACCDTGVPARRRELAEQALARVAVTHCDSGPVGPGGRSISGS